MAAYCESCGEIIDAYNGKMVMLKDDLWLSIANKRDVLCDECIEKRLNRRISVDDFKLGANPDFNFKIPVNMLYAEIKGLKY